MRQDEKWIRFEDFLEMEITASDARNAVAVNPDVSVIFPSLNTYPLLINGQLNIVGDVSLFTRGDSNGDDSLDISDAQATLGYLFSGFERPACLDAADANDDGVLDVSDPVATLGHLFLGSGDLPPPFLSPGVDPTSDALDCAGR